jgi:serine/threonine protein kinase
MPRSIDDRIKNLHNRFSSINEFELIRVLGSGGYSTVNLARHLSTGKKYAIKCAGKYKNGKDISDRTMTEIEVLCKFNHRSIIRVSGWFEDIDTIYIVLQYVPGRDLAKFFKKKLPSKENLAYIMKQIVSGVGYCHYKGVIHRDMKLENILIDGKLKIKLTDFGLCAVKNNDDEFFRHQVGTARYTAPELLLKGGYNESIDVWGIGIIFFLLLTGEYPFNGSERKKIFSRIINKHIDYSQYDLNKDEIHLLKRLLCKDPRHRIQLDDICNHQWFRKYLK